MTTGGGFGDNGSGGSAPPEELPDNCDTCTLLQFIAEEVIEIKKRLNLFEAQFGDFDSQNAWYKEWDFTPELLFVPPEPPTVKGNGLGIGALFSLLLSIGGLIGLVHEDLKLKDNCVAMPEHWQFKVEGHRPQLVVSCAEMKEDGTLGSAKYVVTIPHYQLIEENPPPPFLYMFKGKYYGVLKLNDNSKVQVYCDSEVEARRVLNSIAPWIDPNQTFQTYPRTGEISNPLFKNVTVYPKYATFYSKGTHPDSEVTRIYWGEAVEQLN